MYDAWNVAQEKDSKNKIAFNELGGLGLDQVFSRTTASGSPSYFLTDALGSTVGLADTSGVVQTSYTYEPFGRTTVSGASSTTPFAFTGRENDSTGALALYNYRARSYSPVLQRFLTEDPIGFAGGDLNLYAHVRNGPTHLADPLGMYVTVGGSGRKDFDCSVGPDPLQPVACPGPAVPLSAADGSLSFAQAITATAHVLYGCVAGGVFLGRLVARVHPVAGGIAAGIGCIVGGVAASKEVEDYIEGKDE